MLDVRDVRRPRIADERAARARSCATRSRALERQLSDAVVSAFPHGGVAQRGPARPAARAC